MVTLSHLITLQIDFLNGVLWEVIKHLSFFDWTTFQGNQKICDGEFFIIGLQLIYAQGIAELENQIAILNEITDLRNSHHLLLKL